MEGIIILKTMILKGRKVFGGVVEGKALVVKQPLTAFPDINIKNGIIRHAGESMKGKVLVFPWAYGASGWGSGFYKACITFGNAPIAIINKKLHNYVAVAAAVLEIPTVCDLDKDPIELMETGDHVKVDADRGIVEVTKIEQASEI
jgi:predicted aconitase with swiveling domain